MYTLKWTIIYSFSNIILFSNTVRGEPVGGIGTSIVIDNSIGTNILVDSKRRRCTPPSTDTNTQGNLDHS